MVRQLKANSRPELREGARTGEESSGRHEDGQLRPGNRELSRDDGERLPADTAPAATRHCRISIGHQPIVCAGREHVNLCNT